MNYKAYWPAVFLLSLALSGCANRPPIIQKVTEYGDVPLQFHSLLPIPETLKGETDGTISVEQAIDKGKELRIHACYLHTRYRELLRIATFGNRLLPLPADNQCKGLELGLGRQY